MTKVTRVIVLLILIALLVAAIIGDSWLMAHAAVLHHYTRDYGVLIQTRKNGSWLAHCHNVRVIGKAYIFGGCLPPSHF